MKRNRKRLTAWLLALTLVLCACAGPAADTPAPGSESPTAATEPGGTTPTPSAAPSAAAEPLFQAGTYTGSAKGKNGAVNVEVTFSEQEITKVVIGENTETEHIFRAVKERIPEQIVAAQSLNVDAVAGATLSRAAILQAVNDCIEQAGAKASSLKGTLEKVPEADKELSTQVLVVGSGIAGLAAAIEAGEAGAEVLLIEKLAVIGGSSSVSGGKLQASESSVMAACGSTDTKEAFAKYLMDCARDMADPEMIKSVADRSAENVEWLKALGVQFMDKTVSLHPYRSNVARGHLPIEQKGYGYTTPMENKVRELGIEILTETPAVSLLMEGDRVVGVEAKGPTGNKVTIHADAVILCTGAFDRNEELMAQYLPLITPYVSSGVPGNTGDGLLMAQKAGAEIISRPGCIGNCLDVTFTYMTSTNGGSYQAASSGLFVAGDGERFVDENNFSFARTAAMLDRGYTCFYSVFDQSAYVEGLENAISMKRAFKADTIGELAEQIGMKPDTLEATVKRYNELCEKQKDEDYNKPAEYMLPVAEGPYYALLHTYVISGTFGGPKVNMDGQVLNTSGAAIPGLYAAGEVANGQYLCYEYPGSGSALSSYLNFGRLTGAAAAREVLKK